MTPEEFLRQEAAAATAAATNNKAHQFAVVDAIPAEFSDEAIALKFTETHSDKLRYVAAWGKWLLWNGTRWGFDCGRSTFLERSVVSSVRLHPTN